MWDRGKEGDLRVLVMIDDGGWHAHGPLVEDFIIAPDGSFVGEYPTLRAERPTLARAPERPSARAPERSMHKVSAERDPYQGHGREAARPVLEATATLQRRGPTTSQ